MTVGVMAVVAFAAVLYGLDKSLAPGAGILAVATLTAVMPAKEATGITLIMAIVADWSAIWAYRGNVSRRSLIRPVGPSSGRVTAQITLLALSAIGRSNIRDYDFPDLRSPMTDVRRFCSRR